MIFALLLVRLVGEERVVEAGRGESAGRGGSGPNANSKFAGAQLVGLRRVKESSR